MKLPILTPDLTEQRYSCHGCGNCCRDFTVQLRDEDLALLREQGWAEKLGEPVTVEFRGTSFLRQRDDGACVFLQDDGRCRIHAEYGLEAKPIACQLFPFSFAPDDGGVRVGLNFACQSMLENKGAELPSHRRDLKRMIARVPEADTSGRPPMLTDQIRSARAEVDALVGGVDGWMQRVDIELTERLAGVAWVASSLASARLGMVRGEQLIELINLLFAALPDELRCFEHPPATPRQRKMLRQAVFARTEDPKISGMQRTGRVRTVLGQLARSRRFAQGRGETPALGPTWLAGAPLEAVEQVEPASDGDDRTLITDLIARYVRASVLGGRTWGAGYYGWPVTAGLEALVLNVTCVGWLARLHAAASGASVVSIDDVRAALGRLDRTAGRAPWLGSRAERIRLAYLRREYGAWRLLLAYPLVS